MDKKIIRWVFGIFFGSIGLLVFLLLLASWHMRRHPDIPAPDFSDLMPNPQPVPEADNAFPLLVEAGNLLVKTDDPDLLNDFLEGDLSRIEEVRELLEKNRPAFELMRKAAKRQGLYYDVEYRYDFMIPWVGNWLTLSQYGRVQARIFRLDGTYLEAVALLADLNRFGESVTQNASILIEHLVGLAVQIISLDETFAIVRDPEVPVHILTDLADSLPDPSLLIVGMERALQAEFMSMMNAASKVEKAKTWIMSEMLGPSTSDNVWGNLVWNIPGVSEFGFHPNQTLLWIADDIRQTLAFRKDSMNVSFPNIQFRIDEWMMKGPQDKILQPNAVGYMFYSLLVPSLKGLAERNIHAEIGIHTARLLIALRRHELTLGTLPDSLETLVPTYLSEIPTDPYSGKPFRYDPARAIVYSVGEDGLDQGGSIQPKEGEYRRGPRLRDAEDMVYSLRMSFEEMWEAEQGIQEQP